MNFGFVINNETCIGCHACSTACKSENEVPLGVNRTWVKSVETGVFPNVRRHFQVTRCNHCANPPCVRICPVTAMYQRDDGIVEFNGDACIGCKACLQACPYDAIYIDPDSGTAAKCHYCSHRTDIGLEPACVIVCPEHSIVAGDMDSPDSEISSLLAERKVTVRKPEQGTAPKLFYIGGDDAAMHPTATERAPATFAWADSIGHDPSSPIRRESEQGLPSTGPISIGRGTMAEQMVQVAYNAQHRVPWHWPVPAYLVTKAVGTGAFLLLTLGFLLGAVSYEGELFLWTALTSIVFTGLTTALLVADLERPERFLRVLTRPQWRSWLTRGAYLLVAFSAVIGLWVGVEWFLDHGSEGFPILHASILVLGIPLATGAALYTAFLFGQAEGRDLWQGGLLPIHLLVQAALAGSAALIVISSILDNLEVERFAVAILAWGLIVDLIMLFAGEFGMPHASDAAALASRDIRSGRYRMIFWIGAVAIGHIIPLVAILIDVGVVPATVLVLVGLYCYEHAFVMAPQQIPNS